MTLDGLGPQSLAFCAEEGAREYGFRMTRWPSADTQQAVRVLVEQLQNAELCGQLRWAGNTSALELQGGEGAQAGRALGSPLRAGGASGWVFAGYTVCFTFFPPGVLFVLLHV